MVSWICVECAICLLNYGACEMIRDPSSLENEYLFRTKQENHRNTLKTVDHNVLLPIDLLVHQEVTHVRSLISLKLNNLSVLLILHNGTVACKTPLPRLQDQLQIQVGRQSLNGSDTLSTVSLLNTNMWLIKEMKFVH